MDRSRVRLYFLTSPIMTQANDDYRHPFVKQVLNSRVSESTSNVNVRVQDCRFASFSNLGRVNQGRIGLCITYVPFNQEGTITISNSQARIHQYATCLSRANFALVVLCISAQGAFRYVSSI